MDAIQASSCPAPMHTMDATVSAALAISILMFFASLSVQGHIAPGDMILLYCAFSRQGTV